MLSYQWQFCPKENASLWKVPCSLYTLAKQKTCPFLYIRSARNSKMPIPFDFYLFIFFFVCLFFFHSAALVMITLSLSLSFDLEVALWRESTIDQSRRRRTRRRTGSHHSSWIPNKELYLSKEISMGFRSFADFYCSEQRTRVCESGKPSNPLLYNRASVHCAQVHINTLIIYKAEYSTTSAYLYISRIHYVDR